MDSALYGVHFDIKCTFFATVAVSQIAYYRWEPCHCNNSDKGTCSPTQRPFCDLLPVSQVATMNPCLEIEMDSALYGVHFDIKCTFFATVAVSQIAYYTPYNALSISISRQGNPVIAITATRALARPPNGHSVIAILAASHRMAVGWASKCPCRCYCNDRVPLSGNRDGQCVIMRRWFSFQEMGCVAQI
jgi:hypothetical protein